MSTGLGTCSAGSAPVGFGDADDVPSSPERSAFSRYLNPATKSYEYDADTGSLSRMPPLKQRALLAIMTAAKSSSVLRDWGLQRPQKMGANFEQLLDSEIRRALYRLTDVERVMRIDAITIERDTSRARPTIIYTDLNTGTKDELTSG